MEWQDGERLQVDDDGKAYLTPNMKTQTLADASFMWEREPAAASQ
ncbi:MAG: hypothetical protein SFX73_09070 [Kofleriaceae bacterium]|nr:hypothetical protein [Kofleriaceae bacterium]